jgi:hypothetical protein
MKPLKSSWKVWLGMCAGLVLGMIIFNAPTIKAQARMAVYVEKVFGAQIGVSQVRGSRVVGFSCVLTDSDTKSTECYIATQ